MEKNMFSLVRCIICSESTREFSDDNVAIDKGEDKDGLESGLEKRAAYDVICRQHYWNFLKEVLQLDREETKWQLKDLEILESLPVCEGCVQVMKSSLDKKTSTRILEDKVKELQGQVRDAMKRWEEQLKEYYMEMKRIKEMILKGSDITKLEVCSSRKIARNGSVLKRSSLESDNKVDLDKGREGNGQKEDSVLLNSGNRNSDAFPRTIITETTGVCDKLSEENNKSVKVKEDTRRQEAVETREPVGNHFTTLVDSLKDSILCVIRELHDKYAETLDGAEHTRKTSRRLKGKAKRLRTFHGNLADAEDLTASMMPLFHCAVKMEAHGDGVSRYSRKRRRKAVADNSSIPDFSIGTEIKGEPVDDPMTTQELEEFTEINAVSSAEKETLPIVDDGFEPEVIGEMVFVNIQGQPQSHHKIIKRNRDPLSGNTGDKGVYTDEDSQSNDGNDPDDESLDTSDDDFLLDEGEEDLGSESESSSSSAEDDHGDEEEKEYGRKKAKTKKKETRDNERKEPSPSSKRSRRATYTRALNCINFSRMSKLRRKLVQRVLHKKYRRPQRKPKTPGKEEVDDPRLEHFIEYDPLQDTFTLGGIRILVHEEKDEYMGDNILCLECSACGWHAKPTHNSRHPADSFIYNHIAGQHLNLFQCVQCGSNLGGYKQYSDHVLGHRMGFACDVCGRPLGGSQALARHKWSHLNDQETAELVAKGLKDPREKKESSKIYPCTTCGKIFPQRCQLTKHEKVHAEVRERITCEICGKLFLPSGFISHKRYYCFPEGVEQPRISCPLCPKVFKNRQFMQVHMDRAHNTERNHKCPQCGKGFKTKKDLMTHEETHTTERAFSCKKGCNRTYKTRKNCNAHEKRCDGRGGVLIQRFLDAGQDRPFSCRKGCGRAYKTRRTLRGHEKNCSGAPFVAELVAGGVEPAGGPGQTISQVTTTMTAFGAALQASMEAVMEEAVGIQTVVTEEVVVPDVVATETVVTKTEY